MSGSKLHPIYSALDAHQYTRAAKLAAALPDSNTLGKALLAHAYSKSGQKHAALVTLGKILGSFCELQQELETSHCFSGEYLSKPSPQTEQKSSAKKGKKGKKKQSFVTTEQVPYSNGNARSTVQHLDNQPTLPEGWEVLPPRETAIVDEVR
eukprot:scaffold22577_cov122-Cylindrotheca_fusiformis.AAC.18